MILKAECEGKEVCRARRRGWLGKGVVEGEWEEMFKEGLGVGISLAGKSRGNGNKRTMGVSFLRDRNAAVFRSPGKARLQPGDRVFWPVGE